ncbi:MAG: acyltransferase family protein [Pseudomonadota bacterium]
MKTSQNYFKEVDGLRAVAVLSVLAYHADVYGFSGGFVGVDIFFVISGFLITRLIATEVEAGAFRITNFYLRRARRLLPALFVTLAAAIIVAAILFTPTELARTAASGVYAALSFSNVYFWLESGYFDASAELKPFLHTWSLGVEEQFYLVWPALISFLVARAGARRTLFIIIVLGAISLGAGELVLSRTPSAVFYLTPFRIIEFAFGAGLYFYAPSRSSSPRLGEMSMAIAWLVMIFSIAAYTDTSRFPALGALTPSIGAALAIYGGNARFFGAPLRLPLVVWLGKISYSLYLVHWPIIVFTKYLFGSELNTAQQLSIMVISIGLAGLMERFIERPFRRPSANSKALSPRAFAAVCVLCATGIIAVSASAWLTGGWRWRYGDAAINFDLLALRKQSLDAAKTHLDVADFTGRVRKIVVVGDSHARDTANALSLVSDTRTEQVLLQQLDDRCALILAGRALDIQSAPRRDCEKQLGAFRDSLRIRHADIILFSSLWNAESAELLPKLVEFARERSDNPETKIMILGAGDRFFKFHRDALKMLQEGADIESINKAAAVRRWRGIDAIDAKVRLASRKLGLPYLSRHNLVCTDDLCDFMLENNMPAYWDHTHWSLAGARIFGERLMPLIRQISAADAESTKSAAQLQAGDEQPD